MAQVPGHPLRRDPGDEDRPARARLAVADGDGAGRLRAAPDARLPGERRELLRHVRAARPRAQTDVYVCTNISCSLLGADELYAHVKDVLGGDPDFNVRAFECLGACDIAPMASVDGVYVGPLVNEDVERLRDDVKAGREVLPDKQLARRKAASKHWNR